MELPPATGGGAPAVRRCTSMITANSSRHRRGGQLGLGALAAIGGDAIAVVAMAGQFLAISLVPLCL